VPQVIGISDGVVVDALWKLRHNRLGMLMPHQRFGAQTAGERQYKIKHFTLRTSPHWSTDSLTEEDIDSRLPTACLAQDP
jgi:hypothetical protein